MDGIQSWKVDFPFTRWQESLAQPQPTFALLLKIRPSTDLSRADCSLSTTTSFWTTFLYRENGQHHRPEHDDRFMCVMF